FSEVRGPIRNPLTGQPFAGNIIPPSQISSIAVKLLTYYPAPNQPGTASNFQANAPGTENVDQVLTRVDQNIGNKIRLYARFNWHDSTINNITSPPVFIPTSVATQPRVNRNLLVAYTHTLRPNLLNDFRIGYHRLEFDTLNYFSVNNVTSAGTDLGIPGFNGDVTYTNPGIPSVNVTGFSGLGAGGTNWSEFDTTFQLSNVTAYTHGSHNLRAGFDLRRLATGRRAANDPR